MPCHAMPCHSDGTAASCQKYPTFKPNNQKTRKKKNKRQRDDTHTLDDTHPHTWTKLPIYKLHRMADATCLFLLATCKKRIRKIETKCMPRKIEPLIDSASTAGLLVCVICRIPDPIFPPSKPWLVEAWYYHTTYLETGPCYVMGNFAVM